ncbi:hypothetical protein JCM10213_008272 [Rhodosporidiobolus nylandii]
MAASQDLATGPSERFKDTVDSPANARASRAFDRDEEWAEEEGDERELDGPGEQAASTAKLASSPSPSPDVGSSSTSLPLPAELLDKILASLPLPDLKSCSLASRAFLHIVRPRLFRSAHLSILAQHTNNPNKVPPDWIVLSPGDFDQVALFEKSPHLAAHILRVRIDLELYDLIERGRPEQWWEAFWPGTSFDEQWYATWPGWAERALKTMRKPTRAWSSGIMALFPEVQRLRVHSEVCDFVVRGFFDGLSLPHLKHLHLSSMWALPAPVGSYPALEVLEVEFSDNGTFIQFSPPSLPSPSLRHLVVVDDENDGYYNWSLSAEPPFLSWITAASHPSLTHLEIVFPMDLDAAFDSSPFPNVVHLTLWYAPPGYASGTVTRDLARFFPSLRTLLLTEKMSNPALPSLSLADTHLLSLPSTLESFSLRYSSLPFAVLADLVGCALPSLQKLQIQDEVPRKQDTGWRALEDACRGRAVQLEESVRRRW